MTSAQSSYDKLRLLADACVGAGQRFAHALGAHVASCGVETSVDLQRPLAWASASLVILVGVGTRVEGAMYTVPVSTSSESSRLCCCAVLDLLTSRYLGCDEHGCESTVTEIAYDNPVWAYVEQYCQ